MFQSGAQYKTASQNRCHLHASVLKFHFKRQENGHACLHLHLFWVHRYSEKRGPWSKTSQRSRVCPLFLSCLIFLHNYKCSLFINNAVQCNSVNCNYIWEQFETSSAFTTMCHLQMAVHGRLKLNRINRRLSFISWSPSSRFVSQELFWLSLRFQALEGSTYKRYRRSSALRFSMFFWILTIFFFKPRCVYLG